MYYDASSSGYNSTFIGRSTQFCVELHAFASVFFFKSKSYMKISTMGNVIFKGSSTPLKTIWMVPQKETFSLLPKDNSV